MATIKAIEETTVEVVNGVVQISQTSHDGEYSVVVIPMQHWATFNKAVADAMNANDEKVRAGKAAG